MLAEGDEDLSCFQILMIKSYTGLYKVSLNDLLCCPQSERKADMHR